MLCLSKLKLTCSSLDCPSCQAGCTPAWSWTQPKQWKTMKASRIRPDIQQPFSSGWVRPVDNGNFADSVLTWYLHKIVVKTRCAHIELIRYFDLSKAFG